MTRDTFDFDRLLSPLAAEQFFATHWERQHIRLARGTPGYYDALIAASDVETIICDSSARYPAIRLARDGGYYAAEAYTRNLKHGDETFVGVADVRRISEEYRRGATVVLPAIHRTWAPLGRLCSELERQFDHAAHANCYITAGNAKGFTPHYDVHEVFVLQIAGHKNWQLYPRVVPLPHRSQPCTPQTYKGQAPMEQVELHAGDLLYLPRGVLHSTTTSDSFSVHVTIGVTVYTWFDLVKEYLQCAEDVDDLRRALPPGFASRSELKPLLVKKLSEALDLLRGSADTDKLIDSFSARVRAGHVPRPDRFRTDLTVIDQQSLLQVPAAASYRLSVAGDGVLLEFNGTRYQLPAIVLPALRAIVAQRTFRTSDLSRELDAELALGLSRHLLDIGFVRLVAPG